MNKKDLSDVIYCGGIRVLKQVAACALIGVAADAAYGYGTGRYNHDSTDGEERSGLHLHVDALTGCHYLSTTSGGDTPRVAPDGRSPYGCTL